jgi:AAHS family 4-hydroxybenzoate transporter-like MFS transporter
MGAVLPVAMTIVSEYAPARKRAALIAMVSCAMPLGSAFAGMVAPVIEAWGGWRAIFWAGAITPCLAAVALRLAMPESWSMLQKRGADAAVRAQLRRIAPAHANAPLAPVTPAPEPGAKQRGSLQLIWSNYRGLALLFSLTSWFNLFTSYSLISWAPTLLNLGGVELGTAQRAVGMMAFGAIAGGLFLSWLADKGHMIAGLGGAYAVAAVIFLLYAAGPRVESLWVVLLPLAGATIVGAQTALGAASAAFFPAVARSTALGLTGGVGRTGAIAGPLVIAALLQHALDPITLLGVLTLPMLVCAGGIALLPAILRKTDRGES